MRVTRYNNICIRTLKMAIVQYLKYSKFRRVEKIMIFIFLNQKNRIFLFKSDFFNFFYLFDFFEIWYIDIYIDV